MTRGFDEELRMLAADTPGPGTDGGGGVARRPGGDPVLRPGDRLLTSGGDRGARVSRPIVVRVHRPVGRCGRRSPPFRGPRKKSRLRNPDLSPKIPCAHGRQRRKLYLNQFIMASFGALRGWRSRARCAFRAKGCGAPTADSTRPGRDTDGPLRSVPRTVAVTRDPAGVRLPEHRGSGRRIGAA